MADSFCTEHAAHKTQLITLTWLIGGASAFILAVMLWAIGILYEIKGTLAMKTDNAEFAVIRQMTIENKTRLDTVEKFVFGRVLPKVKDNTAGGGNDAGG